MRVKLKHKRLRLKFGELADEWAAEDGEQGQDKYLHELVKSNWLSDFEDEEGQSCLFLINDNDKEIKTNRGELLRMLATFSTQTLGELESNSNESWSGHQMWTARLQQAIGDFVRENALWNELAALRMDQYVPLFRETYLKRLSISKDDFLNWCDQHLIDQPIFWGEREASAPQNTESNTAAGDKKLSSAERKVALQKLAEELRRKHPTWTKRAIVQYIWNNCEFSKLKGEDKISSETIERETRLPRPKRRPWRKPP